MFVRNSLPLIKCNILNLGDDTVTKLGLKVHLTVAHASLKSHTPGVGWGQNVGQRFLPYFDFVTAGGIRVSQTHV